MAQIVSQLLRTTIRSVSSSGGSSKILCIGGTGTVRSPILQVRPIGTTQAARNSKKFYTETHEWISVENDIGTVGISDHAQHSLGEVVYLQLPELGAELKQGDECGALESVKAASEIVCPVSGTVTKLNEEASSTPKLVNESCHDKGWLFQLKLSKASELDGLMNEDAYKKYVFSKSDSEH